METPTPGREPGRGGGGSAGRRDTPAHSAQKARGASIAAFGPGARLHALSVRAAFPFAVVLHREPEGAALGTFNHPRDTLALLTHDRGHSWPSLDGETLAAAVLEAGGTAVFAFADIGDALAFHARLLGRPA